MKTIQQLKVGLGGMIRTAAAKIRLGDERADLTPELMEQGFQFALVWGGIEKFIPE
jgi:hypothetical protein